MLVIKNETEKLICPYTSDKIGDEFTCLLGPQAIRLIRFYFTSQYSPLISFAGVDTCTTLNMRFAVKYQRKQAIRIFLRSRLRALIRH